MKTRKGWERSNLDLKDYLTEPCRIDESLYNYLGGAVAPQYCYNGLIQLGEAERSDDDGTMYYMTADYLNGKYFYLGILPEFLFRMNDNTYNIEKKSTDKLHNWQVDELFERATKLLNLVSDIKLIDGSTIKGVISHRFNPDKRYTFGDMGITQVIDTDRNDNNVIWKILPIKSVYYPSRTERYSPNFEFTDAVEVPKQNILSISPMSMKDKQKITFV